VSDEKKEGGRAIARDQRRSPAAREGSRMDGMVSRREGDPLKKRPMRVRAKGAKFSGKEIIEALRKDRARDS
jgi:hypothetical protein